MLGHEFPGLSDANKVSQDVVGLESYPSNGYCVLVLFCGAKATNIDALKDAEIKLEK